MIKEKPNYFVVYSLQMMMYLCRKGFDVKKVSDSEDDPKYKVFLFADSPKIQKAVKAYKKEWRD